MQNWEYQTVETSRKMSIRGKPSDWDPKIDLITWGIKGWELVSVVPVADWHGVHSGITDRLVYYFKRPKE